MPGREVWQVGETVDMRISLSTPSRSRFAVLAVVFIMAGLAAPAVQAQLPAATRYVASSFGGTSGNALLGLDAVGAVTTVVPLIAPVSAPVSISMAPSSDAVLIWNEQGVHRYDLATGVNSFSTLSTGGGSIHWGCVDEDGGMLWCIGRGTSQGDLYRSDDTAGQNTHRLMSIPLNELNAVCWIGSTGNYALAQYSALGGNLYFLARDGTVTSLIPGFRNLSGLDWNPWDDKVYASQFGLGSRPGILQIDPHNGQVCSVGPTGPLSWTTNAVKTIQQPINELLCAEYGPDPQHLWTLDPVTHAATTIHASNGVIGFSDAAVLRDRQLWAVNAWIAGQRGNLSVNFGPSQGGASYQVAVSLSLFPDIPVGPAGNIHLMPDHLFIASVVVGSPLFNDFAGVLDLQGRPSRTPNVNIPNLAGLRGLRIYGAAAAYTSLGIRVVSNAWGITIQ